LTVFLACTAAPRLQARTNLVPPGDPGLRPFSIAMSDVRLPSGLRLLVEPDPSVPLVGIVEVVGGGAASDPPGRAGLSTLLARLGQRSRLGEGRSLGEARERAGIHTVEVTTAFDETSTVEVAPREALGELIRLTCLHLADPLAGLTQADVDRERAVLALHLREQIETGQPSSLLTLVQQRLFPPGHPYRSPLGGSIEGLAGIGLGELRTRAALAYRTDNITLLAFGDLDEAALGRALGRFVPGRLFQTAPTAPAPPPASPTTPPPLPPGRLVRGEAALVSPELWIGWSLPAASNPAVHDLLADYVESELAHPQSPGEKSEASDQAMGPLEKRLIRRQVETLAVSAAESPNAFAHLSAAMVLALAPMKNPLVAPLSAEDPDILDLSTFALSGRQGGMLVCRIRLRDGTHPEASLEHVLNQLYRMWYAPAFYGGRFPYDRKVADALHTQRAASTRFRVAVRMALGATDTLDRVRWTARRVHDGGDGRVYERSIESIDALTESWMEHYAYDWINRSRARAIYLVPTGGAAPRQATPLAARPDRQGAEEPTTAALESTRPGVPSVPTPSFDSARTVRLPNGLQVVLVRRADYPVVTVRLGLLEADSPVAGAIELASHVAAPASRWHGATAEHGAIHQEEVGPDLVAYELSGGADALPRLLAQLGDRVRSMEVQSSDVGDFRRLWLPLLAREDGRAEVRAERRLWHALYPQRAFGRRVSFAELGRVDAGAAADWVHRAYTPDRALLAVVGDLDLDQAQRLVERWLGDWKPIARPPRGEVRVVFGDRTTLVQPPPTPPPPPQPALILEHRPGAEAVELRLACRLPDAVEPGAAHEYELAAELLATAVGAELTGSGLGADISAHAETLQDGASHLELAGLLAGPELTAALAGVGAAWDALAAGPIGDEILARARARLAGRLTLRFDTARNVAREVLAARRRGWALAAFDRYAQDVLTAPAERLSRLLAGCRKVRVLSLVGDEPRIRAALAAAPL
jgi:predicted Zn-dependent peptidase